MRTLAFCVMFVFMFSRVVNSQDEESVELRSLLKQVLLERQRPAVYEVEFKMTETRKVPNGRGELEGSIHEVSGLIRFDEPEERLLVQIEAELLDALNSEQALDQSDYLYKNFRNAIRIRVPGSSVIYFTAEKELSMGDPSKDLFSELPFDMRIIGLSWATDSIARRKSLEVRIKELNDNYGKTLCKFDENGVATLDLRNDILRIDTKKEYWPIERLEITPDFFIGKKIKVESGIQRTSLKQFENRWVPEVITMRSPTHLVKIELNWISIDRPFAKDAFDLDANLKKLERKNR